MGVKFELRNPDELEATISITLKVREFRELKKQLHGTWPSYDLGRCISDVIRQAEERFYPKLDGADGD